MEDKVLKFPEKHPAIFIVILSLVGLVVAGVLSRLFAVTSIGTELGGGLLRILFGLLFALIGRRLLHPHKAFRGFVMILPAFLFAVFNVANHYMTGGTEYNLLTGTMIILSLAPAIYEEVIFRGLQIGLLQRKYDSPIRIVVISAAVFSLVHLTNLVGMNVIAVLIQVVYSMVIGMVLGAVYLKSGDLISVILVHMLIDLTSRIFPGTGSTPYYVLGIYAALLILEVIYALVLTGKKNAEDPSADQNMHLTDD